MAGYLSRDRYGRPVLVALFVLLAGQAQAGASETGPRAVADRQQVAEWCSQQADALGLHEQERWDFRARCKSQGSAAFCSQQADSLGLHGEARWIFRARCKA